MKISFHPLRRKALVVEMVVYDPAARRRRKLRAAIDTAASTTLISLTAARALGYDVDRAPTTRIAMGGGVFDAPVVTLDRVDIGPVSVRNVEAVCHDLPQETRLDAVIGLSYLTRFDIVHLDFRDWSMDVTPSTAGDA